MLLRPSVALMLPLLAATDQAAVVSGATLGGAGEEEIEKLRIFSQNIGLAFQVGATPA